MKVLLFFTTRRIYGPRIQKLKSYRTYISNNKNRKQKQQQIKTVVMSYFEVQICPMYLAVTIRVINASFHT